MREDKNDSVSMKFLILALTVLVGVFGVTFSLLLDKMNTQERIAATNIQTLRDEILNTRAESKDTVAATTLASQDAMIASASAMRDALQASANSFNDKIATMSNRVDRLEDKRR